MKHVSLAWLRRFQFSLVGVDLLILGIYLYGLLAGSPAGSHTDSSAHAHSTGFQVSAFGINILIVGLATLHAVYALGIVWWLDKRSAWAAHAGGALSIGILLVLLANGSGSNGILHLLYHLLLMGFLFVAAMAGVLVVGVTVGFAFLLLIIASLGPAHLTADPGGHVTEMILISLSALSGSAGWFIFSKRYIQHADMTVVQTLTSLVKQERNTVGLILESITDGVMVINPKGAIQLLNAATAKMLDWTKEEAQNLQYDSILQLANTPEEAPGSEPPPVTKPLPIAQVFKSGRAQQEVNLIKTRSGRQVYIDITASPIMQEEHSADGAVKKVMGVIAVLRDVDKQKREEQQRGEFISTASHEMRTPVAAIEGYLALALNDKVSGIDSKARGYLEKAHESTQHLGKLFQDLLTSTKADDGRLSNHPVVIEMGQYLEQLADSLRFAAEKKGLLVDFTMGTSDSEDPGNNPTGKVVKPLYYIHADPDRMREVITNLFDNAVKYTESGKISLGLTGNHEVVQFYVRDTGAGIPAADIPHLFQKFYRVDNSATRTIGGTGLGLFICRKIVELYKGRIWVESDSGKGSTFYINLPRLTAQKASELQAAETASASPLSS